VRSGFEPKGVREPLSLRPRNLRLAGWPALAKLGTARDPLMPLMCIGH